MRGKRGGERVRDVACKRLGGRIDAVEGRGLVQISIPKRRDDLAEQAFDEMEVAEQFLAVEPFAGDRDHHAPVVTVQALARAREDDRMRRGELALDLKGVARKRTGRGRTTARSC